MLGMDAAKCAERTWKPWQFLLMEVISFTFHEIEEQRQRGLVIDEEYVEQLIRMLQKWYVATRLKKTPLEVRQMVEDYLTEHSVSNPEPCFREPSFHLPLFDELRQVDSELRERFATPDKQLSLMDVGLIFSPELDEGRYAYCTPLNCRVFAHNGGGGTHFSFLLQDNRIDDRSPIVMTLPSFNGESFVVGENLFDFLRLGVWTGWFVLQQLPSNLDECVQPKCPEIIDEPGTWEREWEEDKRRVLDYVIERLGLKPWTNAVHFKELQYKYAHLLQFPPDCDWRPESSPT